MIDMINFTLVFLTSFFAIAIAFSGIFAESKRGYITNDILISIASLIIFGLYGVYISFTYILKV